MDAVPLVSPRECASVGSLSILEHSSSVWTSVAIALNVQRHLGHHFVAYEYRPGGHIVRPDFRDLRARMQLCFLPTDYACSPA
jgi:hypothetical protein